MTDNLKTWPESIYKPNINYENYPHKDEYLVDSDDIVYIRVDITREREAKLLWALKDARDDIIEWAAYANEHFREKYRLDDCIEQYDNIIAKFEELE